MPRQDSGGRTQRSRGSLAGARVLEVGVEWPQARARKRVMMGSCSVPAIGALTRCADAPPVAAARTTARPPITPPPPTASPMLGGRAPMLGGRAPMLGGRGGKSRDRSADETPANAFLSAKLSENGSGETPPMLRGRAPMPGGNGSDVGGKGHRCPGEISPMLGGRSTDVGGKGHRCPGEARSGKPLQRNEFLRFDQFALFFVFCSLFFLLLLTTRGRLG